jgi:hypothetical protein
MTNWRPLKYASIALGASLIWLASSRAAWADFPILLADKSWAVGYILVALCIFLGLLAICIPRLRRVNLVEEEPAPKQGQAPAGAARPASPYAQQYGQFGQQPGQKPAYGQQGRPAPAQAGGGALKSRKVAGLLGLFLGGWGVHRFYLGYSGIGAAMIAVTFCTCGVGAWWGVIEGIMLLTGGGPDRDASGRPLGP